MLHYESSIKIFFTKDYACFKMIEGNRQLSEPKIKRILKDIENGIDLLRYCPILVIEKEGRLQIIDGQHRFYVAKKIGSKVWYIVAEELNLYEIARMNSNTEKWNAKDFINCYSQLGNKEYDVLREFTETFPVPVTSAICLLQNGRSVSGGGHEKDAFEHGNFKVKYLEQATALLNICTEFQFDKKYSRPFLRAVEKIINGKKIKVDELVEKTNKDISALKFIETEKQFLTALEEIYNKGKHSRTVIW
jgi:hypothetical protein